MDRQTPKGHKPPSTLLLLAIGAIAIVVVLAADANLGEVLAQALHL